MVEVTKGYHNGASLASRLPAVREDENIVCMSALPLLRHLGVGLQLEEQRLKRSFQCLFKLF